MTRDSSTMEHLLHCLKRQFSQLNLQALVDESSWALCNYHDYVTVVKEQAVLTEWFWFCNQSQLNTNLLNVLPNQNMFPHAVLLSNNYRISFNAFLRWPTWDPVMTCPLRAS